VSSDRVGVTNVCLVTGKELQTPQIANVMKNSNTISMNLFV
jgi:hypothetical protein